MGCVGWKYICAGAGGDTMGLMQGCTAIAVMIPTGAIGGADLFGYRSFSSTTRVTHSTE